MFDFDKKYKIIHAVGDFPYDDFGLCVNIETNEIEVVYSYDGGYAFPSVTMEELLNVDFEKVYERIYDVIGSEITKNKPYSNKNIFTEVNHAGNKIN